MTEDLILRREVKPFGKRGGAYISLPSSLIGQTVTVIHEGKAGKVEVNLSVLSTDFVKANVKSEGKSK